MSSGWGSSGWCWKELGPGGARAGAWAEDGELGLGGGRVWGARAGTGAVAGARSSGWEGLGELGLGSSGRDEQGMSPV